MFVKSFRNKTINSMNKFFRWWNLITWQDIRHCAASSIKFTYHLRVETRLQLFGIRCAPAEPFLHSHNTVEIFQCNFPTFLSATSNVASIHCIKYWTLNLLPKTQNAVQLNILFERYNRGYFSKVICELYNANDQIDMLNVQLWKENRFPPRRFNIKSNQWNEWPNKISIHPNGAFGYFSKVSIQFEWSNGFSFHRMTLLEN